MRDDRERLADILEAIERIEKYAARGRGEFDNEELIQTWIVMLSCGGRPRVRAAMVRAWRKPGTCRVTPAARTIRYMPAFRSM